MTTTQQNRATPKEQKVADTVFMNKSNLLVHERLTESSMETIKLIDFYNN